MRRRSECIEILDHVADYSDDEVTMNRDLIREVASEAAGHLKQAAKIKNESRRRGRLPGAEARTGTERQSGAIRREEQEVVT